MKRIVLAAVIAMFPAMAAYGQRLPENAIPDSYDLSFTPDLTKATFSGEESIHVKLQRPSLTITLNSAEIEIQDATITAAGHPQLATVTFDESKDQATLKVPNALPVGPAEIHIRFTGILNDQMRGFYLSKTARRAYAVTQFESTDARRAFPSFDEPAYKAIFRITLVIDKDDTAISNGRIISDLPGPGEGKHTLKFSPSPKMSSYLVAMMVGDFQCLEGAVDEIPIRVCAVPEKKALGSYALKSAENILQFYDRYYYTKYPFQKLDIIAFPDFAAGAMENVAAITYRESDLLIDDKVASEDAHETVYSVLAHEMAHQWFGDLVTMKWWDDIWLNEGFATWMAWKPMQVWRPEWQTQLEQVQETDGVLDADSIASIRPIRAKAETPAEIDALFDEIAYDKASSVLRMIEAFVGPEVFRKGVNAYVQAHAYGNATAEDFWSAIAATSGKPVDKIMSTFIDEPGAPLVSVKSSCSGDHTTLNLAQQRYFSDPTKLSEPSQEIWEIPVAVRAPASENVMYVVLTRSSQSFDIPGCSSFVLVNPGGRGYFRVDYGAAGYVKMSAAPNNGMTAEDRIRFLGDGWAMVRVGRIGIGDYLSGFAGFQSERQRPVVEAMLSHMSLLHDNIVSTADQPAFEAWLRNFFAPLLHDLGMDSVPGEPGERQELRSEVIAVLSIFGRQPELIARSRATVEAYMKDPASVSDSMARTAVVVAALNGDAALYDKYIEHMKSAKAPNEYDIYFMGLTLFQEPSLVRRTIDYILSPSVKPQNVGSVVGLFSKPEAQSVAWEYFKMHFTELYDKAGPSNGSGLVSIAGRFCDPKLRDDSQNFFASQNLPGTERPLRNALDRVNACIELKKLQQANLSAFLKKTAP
ncbi:MAG: M1 family metallopeptidase [Candidatus Acidiferrales bacterium]